MSTYNEIRKIDSLLSGNWGPNTKILKYETRALTAPGENYGSVMLALDMTVQEPDSPPKVLHLVAKKIPDNQMLCEVFNIQETVRKEIDMYVQVVPTLAKFQEEYGSNGKKISELFAKCYGGRLNLKPDSDFVDEDAVLILENLKILGYDVGDRLVGLDKQHAYRLLEDLARFHAVPIAHKIIKPDEFNKIIKPVIKGCRMADGFPEDSIQKSIQDIEVILEQDEICKKYIKQIKETVLFGFSGLSRMYDFTEPFATINHTDFWVNNTMILKNSQGQPIKTKIVDFQLTTYNSGVSDLLFFIFSSIMPELVYGNIDKYMKHYYDCFIECLEEFDVDVAPFSWESFEDELLRVAPIELGHILIMFQPILTKRGAIEDMSSLSADTMVQKDLMSPDYEERILNCVKYFAKQKWIQEDK